MPKFIIARTAKGVITDDNQHYAISNMFDCHGEDTEDPNEAVTIVVQFSDDEWGVYRVDTLRPVTLQ